MSLWLEQNLPAVLIGFGLGAVSMELLYDAPYSWIVGGLAGTAVALPIWQVLRR